MKTSRLFYRILTLIMPLGGLLLQSAPLTEVVYAVNVNDNVGAVALGTVILEEDTITEETLDRQASKSTNAVYPVNSNASGKIAFVSDRDGNYEIYVMNTDGTNQTQLTNNSFTDFYVSWSPDGQQLAFSSNRDGNFELYVMNADGTNQIRLTNHSAIDWFPRWSPDGSQLVFQTNRDGNDEIYVMNSDGSNQTQLTSFPFPQKNDAPHWSPDGNQIVFYSMRDQGRRQIYVMNADGSNQTRLTNNNSHDWDPKWSPDSSRIVFSSERDGNHEIYVMNADGTDQTRLTFDAASDRMPAWSPDGSQIVFQSNRDGNSEIYVMNADGTNQTRLTNNDDDDFHSDWGAVNQSPIAVAGGPYTVDEGGSVQLDGSGSSDPDPGDTLTYEWDLGYDGVTFEMDAVGVQPAVSFADNFPARPIALRVTDSGGLTDIDDTTLEVNNVAPLVDTVVVPLEPVNINDQILGTIDVTFSDPAGTSDEPYNCDFDLDNDGLNDATVSGVKGTSCNTPLNYAEPGVYTVKVTVTDKDGGSGSATAIDFIVIYDPSGGFVTGGGWIDSPDGACPAFCGGVTGKATFGFVSKYKKGADVPTGNTEFQFKAGNLNFHSTSYQWLVVAGPKAQFKGDGTINGAGNYGFMLTAIDEALTPSTNVDLFRIKIWDKDNGDTVVYDNQMGESDDSDAATAIGSGSIVIHKAK